jgi:hypothetical protein
MARNSEFGAGIGVGQPKPEPLSLKPFSEAFRPEGAKKLGTEIVDLPALQSHRAIRHMADRIAETAATTERKGLMGEALQWYPNERQRNAAVGIAFNNSRAQKGLPLYHPEEPHLAGQLLASGYSQNNNEPNREKLIQKSMATGEIQNHLSTPVLKNAIEKGLHPEEVFQGPKLHDFLGSIAHPETWEGGGQGLGYTIDRHQHDAAMGQKFGNAGRSIASGPSDVRRYRVLQAAHHLAHQFYDPSQNLSRPQFQAASWIGWRGAS